MFTLDKTNVRTWSSRLGGNCVDGGVLLY